MMNKWRVSGVGAGVIILAVLASTLYSSDYLKILAEHPNKELILLDYSERERAEFLLRPLASCPYYLIRVDPTILSLKCGSKVLVVADTMVGSRITKWVNLSRNLSSVKISADESGKIIRETSILKSRKLNGILTEEFSISQGSIKIGFDYVPVGTDAHRIGWRIKKNYGATLQVSDPLFIEQSGNVYWYGGRSGLIKVDPEIILADSNLTYYVWNGTSWFNVTNSSAIDYVRFQCRLGQADCEPTYINKTRGLNDTAGQNASFNRSIFLINNTGAIAVNFVQLKLNDSCSNVNFTVSNLTGGGSKRNLSTGYVNVSGPLLVNATNSTVPIYIFANVTSNITARAANATGVCPPIIFNWEVR